MASADFDAIPPELVPESFAERLYLALAPLTGQEQELGWPLLVLCNAVGAMYQELEIVRDSAEGPGWSAVMDAERCPIEWLPWLGQFAGVSVPGGLDEDEQRAWVQDTGGFKRGTVDALRGAAASTLTGSKSVLLYERSGDVAVTPEYAYYLTVRTYTDQTPDPNATLAALLSQKPGGIVLDYAHVTGQTYAMLKANHATYAAVKTAYPTYAAVAADEPE